MLSREPAGQQEFSRGYRAWLLFILALVNALTLADRQGIAATAQAIKEDLHFTDSEMGMLLGLGFAIFYTLLGLPLARMAERMSRTRIIVGSLAIFGVMAALCAGAQTFWRFMLFRVGVGIGDAGFGPPVASLVGDHYPMERRASAMSLIWLGAPLGVIFGSYGILLAEHEGWRTVFIAIGSAGIVVAMIAAATLREPARGMSDASGPSRGTPPSTWVVLKFLFSKRSMIQVLIGCALAATAMNAIGQYIAQFLLRSFHVAPKDLGFLLSVIAVTSMAAGLLIGGFVIERAARRDQRWYVWGPAITQILAAPAFVLGFSQPTIPSTVAVLMAGHVVIFVYFTPTLAIAQNMVGPNMRASSAFVVSLVIGLVGIGLGPTITGFLSDAFASRAFSAGDYSALCPRGVPAADSARTIADACLNASAAGLRHALMAMSLLTIWAGIHYLLAARSFKRDLETQFQPVRP